MTHTPLLGRRPLGLLVAALVAVEWTVTRSQAFARGGPVPLAVLLDLVVVLPLGYALLASPTRRSLAALAELAAPLFALGAALAAVLLRSRPEARPALAVTGGIAEVAVVALLVGRARRAARELGASAHADFLDRVAGLTDPLSRLLALELGVLYYALVGPRRPPPTGPGVFGYTGGGLGSLIFGLGFVATMEGAAVHLALRAAHPRLALAFAAANAYGLVWLWALWQGARLRPIALTEEALVVRVSLLWTAVVPRSAIANVTRIDEARRDKATLRAALGTSPTLLVTLVAEVVARGPLGLTRRVTRVALAVDEPDRLAAALRP
jgi:hypothetical protein